jgi:hypothetical protein
VQHCHPEHFDRLKAFLLGQSDAPESGPQNANIVWVIDGGIFMIPQDTPDHVVFVKKEAVLMLSKKLKQ